MLKIKSKAIAGFLALAMIAFTAPTHAAVIGGLTLNGNPVQGSGTFDVSGTCPAGGNVNFSLVNSGGTSTSIGPTVTTNGVTGNFNSTLSIPNTYPTGSTTLVATCANGDTVTVPLNITAPATVSPTLTVNGTPVQGNGTFNVNGVCPTNGNVTFSLVNNGVTTNLGTSLNTTGSSNTYNGSLSIPSTYATGGSTLVATCPNGQTITQPITVLAPVADLLSLNTTAPAINGTVNVSGVCGSGNNGGVVNFSVTRGGVTTNLASTTTANGANGAFTTTVTLPANYPSGLATLTATCANGDVVSTLAIIGDPGQIGLTVTPINPNVNGTITVMGVCPTTSTGVSFSVLQNGVTTNIGSSLYALNANGSFSTNLTLPSSVVSGTANLIAACNNNGGSTTTGLVLGVSTSTPVTVTPGATVPSGAVAGVATDPLGGVAAGQGGTASTRTIALFFLLTGLMATALLLTGKKMQENE